MRPYFLNSFVPFAQTYYWRADYGYRGDWQVKRIVLCIDEVVVKYFSLNRTEQAAKSKLWDAIERERNIVREMIAELVAIKPAREPKRELQEPPAINLMAI